MTSLPESFRRIVLTFALATAAAVAGGCQGPQLSPTPNLYVGSDIDPFEHVPAELRSTSVDIVYATDRAPETTRDGSLRYGYGRSKSPTVGITTVQIGDEDLDWSTLAEQSRLRKRTVALPLKVTRREVLVELPEFPVPPERFGPDGVVEHPDLVSAEQAAVAEIHQIIADYLAKTPRKEAYLYVHGYNNTFDYAAMRMAQLWHLGGRGGVPILYSWPAGHGGVLRGYTYDRESGEFTVFHLKQFIKVVAATPGLEKLHIIAHSRGTDVAMTALRELHIEYRGAGLKTHEELRLENVVLAAADLDFEVAQQRIGAERLLPGKRLTVYLSQEDKAIGIADWLFSSRSRLGQLEPEDLTPAQREMLSGNEYYQFIDVDAKTKGVGHAYFVDNPAVLSDMIKLLRDNAGAGAEEGRPMERHAGGFWLIDDDYLVNGD